MEPRVLFNSKHFELTIIRLSHQLIENHFDFSESALVGIQPRGIYLADRIIKQVKALTGISELQSGELDITFFRDDFRRREEPLIPSATNMEFLVEDKKVVLIDDVLFTGRTIRAAMDALLAYGRPKSVELLVLIDRRFSRHLPIQPDYIGKTVDSVASERVKVSWTETDGQDLVTLYTPQLSDE